MRAENAHDKEYIVTVDKPISERFVERMSKGVPILGTITKPCIVTPDSKFVFRIILTQGLNRQIRRMCEYLGYEVTKLKRSRIMNVELANLRPGQWRDLTEQEMAEINSAVAGSRKTAANDSYVETMAEESPVKVAITDIKHANKTIESNADKSSKRKLTRIDVKKTSASANGKKKLSLKKKS